MKIYVVVYDSYDGECSYSYMLKGFTKKEDAENHVKLCTDECIRIRSESDAHNSKYGEELANLNAKIRELILTKGKWLGASEHPESIRQMEILNIERDILRSHKYDENIMTGQDEYIYNIEELEID